MIQALMLTLQINHGRLVSVGLKFFTYSFLPTLTGNFSFPTFAPPPKKTMKQESILVGRVPDAAVTVGGCTCHGGCVPTRGGCTCWGVYLPGGVFAQGRFVSQHALGQTAPPL